jgi:cyanophycin synthetase
MTHLYVPGSVAKDTLSICALIDHHAKVSPHDFAIITSKISLTYQDLENRVHQCALLMIERGIRKNDRIAIIISDELTFLTILLGASRLGCPAMLIPRSSTPSQRENWMSLAGVRHLISDNPPNSSDAAHPAWIDPNVLIAMSEVRLNDGRSFDDLGLYESIFVILVGSGSTGKQKLIPITHKQMLARGRRMVVNLEIDHNDRLASMSHFEYAGGVHRLVAALCAGACFVFLSNDRNDWLQCRIRYGVTILSSTVFHIHQLLKYLRSSSYSGSRPLDDIRLSVSSSVVTRELREIILSELTLNLSVIYGTNEAWTVSTAKPTDVLSYPDTVGKIIDGVSVKVVDSQMQPVQSGEKGLIVVRSDQVIDGYLNDESSTLLAFKEGWFITGDLGYITNDGHLIFCGRSDNLMIFNGINIFPSEIEQCLRSHPAVSDVIAVPTRHTIHQDIPVALVVLKDNIKVNQNELLSYAAAALGPKQPRLVFVIPSIPRSIQGKPIKSEIINILSHEITKHNAKQEAYQNPRQLTVNFIPKPARDAHSLSAWTQLLDAPTEHPPLNLTAPSRESSEAAIWLHHVMAFSLALLQSARIPVFDPLIVSDCQPDMAKPPSWKASFVSPDPLLLPLSRMKAFFVEAYKLAEWACRAEIESSADREAFFQRVENDIFKLLQLAHSRGKSTFEVLLAAHRLSIPMVPLSGGVFQLGWGANARRIDRSTTDHDSVMGMRWTQNKYLSAQLLKQAGLPAPSHFRVDSAERAREAAQRLGYPVVIKPADLERGEGVSVDVDRTSIDTAFEQAHQRSPGKQVLVEQQVSGVCHRLFMVAGKLLYAVKRLPIGVYADGRSTVDALVRVACAAQQRLPPWKRSGIRPIDDLAMAMLDRQGWTPDSIPQEGQFIALRRIESTAWGGVDEDVSDTLHPDNVRAARAASKLFGLEVAGVDIISPDITQPWHVNGAIINEVNFAPLLGGGEISRERIPAYLNQLLKAGGRIPMHVYVGGAQASAAGQKAWKQLVDSGVQAVWLGADAVQWPGGERQVMSVSGLYARCRALLLSPDVEALVLWVQNDEFTHTGLPVDRISSLHEVDGALVSLTHGGALDEAGASRLLTLLRSWCNDKTLGVLHG